MTGRAELTIYLKTGEKTRRKSPEEEFIVGRGDLVIILLEAGLVWGGLSSSPGN